MKKIEGQRKRNVWVAVIIVAVICVAAFHLLVFYIDWKTWRSWEGMTVSYGEMSFSANEKYLGRIDMDRKKVIILSHSGKEISALTVEGEYPDQIALGRSSYFLLYLGQEEKGDARIVQYDYQSNQLKDCTVANAVAIFCQKGFLFVREGIQSDDEYDTFYYASSFYQNYFADRYIMEEEFGREFHALALNGDGRCLVGDVEWYYHDQGHNRDEGYFSTEPTLDDYPGISFGNFDREDKQYDYQTETRQEKENRSLLLKEINAKTGIPYPIFDVREYQKGELIYGVCNVFEKYIAARPDEPEDVVKAFFYKIDPAKDELTILAQKDSCLAMIVSDSVAVYQREDEIVQQDLSSVEEKTLYHIQNTHNLRIDIKEDFMQVIEEEKRFLPFLFTAEEKTPVLVRWKNEE